MEIEEKKIEEEWMIARHKSGRQKSNSLLSMIRGGRKIYERNMNRRRAQGKGRNEILKCSQDA